MTNKQIIVDYKNLCENYSEEVGCYNTFNGSCIQEQCFTYKLLQQLQSKEQECEKYEHLFNELDKRVSNNTKIFDCIVVSKIVKDIINKAKGGV